MITIGMVIGERYEILEKIGMGGMSDVYKAKDHKLNRAVAVKVLKQEFCENANFVSKFRVEAQAAAGLMHPNIVNVYDVGEEGDIHYIVMELVEGITLKKYIEKKARLSAREAISIAIQVSMGIEAAHNHKIIHRDIKPQNIIISKEGKVKVTDFGIAKAATSNTITSNVMGSVHYTSPEQARGGYSDAKSDIYSLGITMFEMLTGRVPYNGETTVAIAIKHIQEDMPSPREYVDDIPISIEQIVLKCCQKSPDRRYQSMGELIVDLKQSLINPDTDFVKKVDSDEAAATRMMSDRDVEEVKVKTKTSKEKEAAKKEMRLNNQGKPSQGKGKNAPKPERPKTKQTRPDSKPARYRSEYDDDEDDEDYDPKMERITTILAIAAALIIGGIIIFLIGRAFGIFGNKAEKEETQQTEDVAQVEMINVVGLSIDEAKKQLIQLGLTPEIQYEVNTNYEEGTVIKSSERAGVMLDMNTNVILTVAEAEEGVNIPSVVGKSETEAKSILEQAGFVVSVTESYDANVTSGCVISQMPEADTTAPEGATVTIRICQSTENEKVRVPNLIGLNEEDATWTLTEYGLTMGVVEEVTNDDEALTGKVCYQSYSVGSYVDKNTAVDVRISTGPAEQTYSYISSIEAPTEQGTYKEGMNVTVIVVAADGTQLLNTTTTTFPLAVNYTGIKTETGTIQFIYQVTTESTVSTDLDTGETIVTPGTTTDVAFTRDVTFTPE